jgi:hypothetical protein
MLRLAKTHPDSASIIILRYIHNFSSESLMARYLEELTSQAMESNFILSRGMVVSSMLSESLPTQMGEAPNLLGLVVPLAQASCSAIIADSLAATLIT